ncbi:branched-chain amino acid ABC transporter permease [Deinococcus sp. SM5_A1]|uniref:branched-chain amino acid ABC transporter permease n=1 Tax=Deinococcus sp. SM5_A1 TaxID=3379094 RepID=UPI00385DF1BB
MNVEQVLFNSLVEGSIIALLAIGITLVFGIARFANAAQGDLATLGAYVGLLANTKLALPVLPAVAVAALAVAAAGVLANRLIFSHLTRRPGISSLIASIGLAILLRHVIILFAGTGQYTYGQPLLRATKLGDLRIFPGDLTLLGVTLVVIVLVHLLLNRTQLGREMRAVADNTELARVAGINSGRVITALWAVSGALAGIAGVLIGSKSIVNPLMGWDLLLPAFAAAILGGLGNPYGALAGAILIGLSQEVAAQFIPNTYKMAVSFIVIVVVLLLRPNGIFGSRSVVK